MSRECPECREEYDYWNQGGPEMLGPTDEGLEEMEKNKLKTLKDLECICFFCNDDSDRKENYPQEVRTTDLRQEIIKWIKELNKGVHPLFANFKVDQCEACSNLLKHIFNITEEELNNDKETKA